MFNVSNEEIKQIKGALNADCGENLPDIEINWYKKTISRFK